MVIVYRIDSWLDLWLFEYWKISFVIKNWIKVLNESLFLEIELDLFVVLRSLMIANFIYIIDRGIDD